MGCAGPGARRHQAQARMRGWGGGGVSGCGLRKEAGPESLRQERRLPVPGQTSVPGVCQAQPSRLSKTVCPWRPCVSRGSSRVACVHPMPPHVTPAAGPDRPVSVYYALGNRQMAPVYEGACSGHFRKQNRREALPIWASLMWQCGRRIRAQPSPQGGDPPCMKHPGSHSSSAGTEAGETCCGERGGTWVAPAHPPAHLADPASPPNQEAR